MTDQIADQTPAATPEAAKPMSAEDIAKLVADSVATALAADRKRNNAEFAEHRKGIESIRSLLPQKTETVDGGKGAGDGVTPKPVAGADVERIADLRYEFGRLEAKAEAQADKLGLEGEDREEFEAALKAIASRPLAERADAMSHLIRGLDLAAKHSAKAGKEEKGRDARSPGSPRGHAPAGRTADGYPTTYEEWAALPVEKQRELRTRFPGRSAQTLPRSRT